jgi:hypothetical protein
MTSGRRISAVSKDAVVHALSKLIFDLVHDHRARVYIPVALAVGFLIGRYRAFRADRALPAFPRFRAFRDYAYQNSSEALLSRVVQKNFGPPDYHLMNHVTLQLTDGTTQVDHILVSRFGVFVIETKHYKGWIFADEKQANWTQALRSRAQPSGGDR